MPAAVAIPLIMGGVSAGAQIYGAKKASDAAGKAATVQNDAAKYAADVTGQGTRDALGLQERMFNQGQAQLAPYTALGRGAGSTLARMMGLPDMPSYEAPQGSAPLMKMGGQNTGAFGQMMQPGRRQPTVGAGTVTLRSPDGEERDVPADQADHYISRGAVRVA